MPLKETKIGVIGAGVMGRALVAGLLEAKLVTPRQVWAAARTEVSCQKIKQELGISATTDYRKQLADTDILLLCTKPSGGDKVLDVLKHAQLPPSTLLISIVAGTTIEHLEAVMDSKNPIIRAMPNTPSVVRQGMTALCGGTHAKASHMKLARQIFDAVGECMELEESHFDAITALCGSGPAYMYLIMEALADGGVRVGLPRDVALKIVTQTVLGAAMMVQKSGRHPAALRDDVTTPAGCTIGALLTMEDGKIRSVLARAVEEATRIAGQLGQKH